ncbi:MAG: YiiX/YebB-like N1pC/P60 family cysteine hydrolase [Gammaproteobacteria bacterium]|nr:YiiX/YebB-like N1pC/P60 family cysteine hydrolase [Gammaproteobacteria bacterium]
MARFLEKPVGQYLPFSISDTDTLQQCLHPGDVLLVEGDLRISVAIKYLTQSTWSHAAIYVGDSVSDKNDKGDSLNLIEADLTQGVIAVPLSKYASLNTRICRPINLEKGDQQTLIEYLLASLGKAYDLKNVIDLMRYLLPTPPVPTAWRRQMLAFGSGDPTQAICSTLIAQAFQKIKYPILPEVEKIEALASCGCRYTAKEILHIRHHSLFTPRDFDLSPYFKVVKPSIEQGFKYQNLEWAD